MIKILLIKGNANAAVSTSRLAISDDDPLAAAAEITEVEGVEEAVDRLESETFDLVFLDVGARGATGLADIARIRERTPATPIIVLTDVGEEALEMAALRAGAQDCFALGEKLSPSLSRAVRFAIERHLFDSEDKRRRVKLERALDTGSLQTICGPQPLPVTEHSFGVQSLSVKAPKDFEELINAYLEVLDQVLDPDREPSESARTRIDSALNRISDRLGMLNAGPRDVVDLHKAAIARIVDGHASCSTIGLIEEGRLLVLQLMGQLVTFYRALSWGLRANERLRAGGSRDVKLPTNRLRER